MPHNQNAGPSGPVFVELGTRPPVDAPRSYPADVRARLEVDAKEILARYPSGTEPGLPPTARRSALLPLLHLVQSEDGYLTPAGMEFCATQLGLTAAEVTAVASFYSMYRREPTGTYYVGVCTNTLCAIMGGDAILTALQQHLNIEPGQTTDDGAITLDHVECNAACDYAPVVMVNWEFFDNQTAESARALVDSLRSGEQVSPSRGAAVCTFRETARLLAGFPDGRAEEQHTAGPATLAGLEVAHERGMAAPNPPKREGA
ncbi:NADH-quinone oxidoreductase subunit NuoE [Skermania sp. ID1734]|uniref:NADH-quinone oxidoreductase subunit NuoE n=1 Tax=Skermania sp. ID1734 TaxID=2597516 RepID=UPI00117CDFD3|nr:NADH-quinone oxidoreductase subunit NuoE [Skermania sp. ID1734]TSD95373.1 NADH-quinone oxidoreductase subunit NuoE [Skermania sp. ID1734]